MIVNMHNGSYNVIKNIAPIASPVVNYLTYIQAYCGINWQIEDKVSTHGFLPDEDRSYLKACSADLSFGDGSLASLAEVFYFLPAYIFRENSEGLTEYFTRLAQCHDVKNMTPLFDGYSHHISRLREFNPHFLSNIDCLEQEEVLLKIKLLCTIYKANYHRYIQTNWDTDGSVSKVGVNWVTPDEEKG